jgi:hypothetical protein
MLIGRWCAELSSHELQISLKNNRLRAAPTDLKFNGPLLEMFFDRVGPRAAIQDHPGKE